MITSGYTHSDATTEVIDLKTGKTFNMPSLGRRTDAATGGLLDGLPVVCGGPFDDQIHSINKVRLGFARGHFHNRMG